ncbi:hypothetical protein MTR_3g086240 [Medicago truncatula]|uniref:Uncharacterized protein n=1 Tax=Medicago truncatula TaxID=3880 RepID=G7J2K9_MEDTR|nr:hypothetical protein MTR_3g086240 [Medicago truncatula]
MCWHDIFFSVEMVSRLVQQPKHCHMMSLLCEIGVGNEEAMKRKHIETKLHFIRHQVRKQRINLAYCRTEMQIADIVIVTKPLKIEKCNETRKMLSMSFLESLFKGEYKLIKEKLLLISGRV